MIASIRHPWPWWHAIWLAVAGAFFAYPIWTAVLGVPADKPAGYGFKDVWLNLPAGQPIPHWAPLWWPLATLGVVGFLLAGFSLRRGGPQTFKTIRLCVYLHILTVPFAEMLIELCMAITLHPRVTIVEGVISVGKVFILSFPEAALLFGFNGTAWIMLSVVVGGLVAQTSRVWG